MKKARIFTLATVFFLIPATLYLGTKLPGRGYYVTSTLVVLYTLIAFFLSFEGRKPQARELVTVAVLCAIAVVSRAAFAMVPHFKPVSAVVMLAGVAFGPQTGFLVGAVTAFASNFFFGQGPWTPWQMLAYGVAGLLAGLVFHKNRVNRHPLALAFFGFFTVLLLEGPLLDTSSVFLSLSRPDAAGVLAIYASGVPVNIIHGTCTFLVMVIFSKPLLEKLERLRVKYGMMEAEHGL